MNSRTRSGSSSEWVSETQNIPANMGSLLPARKVIGWVRSLQKHVPRKPAPSRHINGRPLINGHQAEDLSRQEALQSTPKRQQHRAAGQAARVPGVVRLDWCHVILRFSHPRTTSPRLELLACIDITAPADKIKGVMAFADSRDR